jgi:hypothetical protein
LAGQVWGGNKAGKAAKEEGDKLKSAKLPEDAQKLAASNLLARCIEHRLLPPIALTKTAAGVGTMVGEQMRAAGMGLGRTMKSNALGGAAIGAIGTGGMAAMAAPEGERLKRGLQGAAIGGLGGAAVGAGVGALQHRGLKGAATMGAKGDIIGGFRKAEDVANRQTLLEGIGGASALASGAAIGGQDILGSDSADLDRAYAQYTADTGKPVGSMSMGDVRTYLAKTKQASANVIDITGRLNKTKQASRPTSDDDYAVVRNGQRLYPIHDWDHIKIASDYWEQHRRIMEPSVRREFAMKLAAKGEQLGAFVPDQIKEAGSTTYADPGHLKSSIEMRKCAFAMESEDSALLDELFEKRAELDPGVYAGVLRKFDEDRNLQPGWDNLFLDPWASTFGINKIAKVLWQDGADRLTEEDLINLLRNYSGDIGEVFADESMVKGFEKDPAKVFGGLPDPYKKIIARLAYERANDGSSVMDSYNVVR